MAVNGWTIALPWCLVNSVTRNDRMLQSARSHTPTPEVTLARSTPSIRKARPEDAPRIVEFQQAMALETEGKTLDESLVTPGVAAVFASPDKGFYIVAEVDDSVVGSLLITYEWSDWRNSTFLWIQSVFVDANYRRQGVYTAMHNHVLSLTEADDGLCGVRLYVERTNTNAQQTYKSLGMDHSHYDMYEIDFHA